MSAASANSAQNYSSGHQGCSLILASIGVGMAFMLGLALVLNAALGDSMSLALGVLPQEHAVIRHDEAPIIRNCLDSNGPYMVWKHKDDPTFYLICQLGQDWWGLQAVTDDGVEKTAFSPGNGTWRALNAYLKGFATKYRGPLPWLQ